MQVAETRLDSAAQIAIITWADEEPTIQQCRRTFEALRSNPAFRPEFGILSDRRLVSHPPSTLFIQEFIEQLRQWTRSGACAAWVTVVGPGELAVYGMARMAEIRSEFSSLPYRAFLDYDEAVEWLRTALGTPRPPGDL